MIFGKHINRYYLKYAGWLLLGQTLTVRELAGCAVMFAAILLAQL